MNDERGLSVVPNGTTWLQNNEPPASVLQKYVNNLDTGGLPVHLYQAHKAGFKSARALATVLSSYTGNETDDVKDHLNKEINILGAAIIEHGPYNDLNGNLQPGYCYVVLKTNLTRSADVIRGRSVVRVTKPVYLKTSANQICDLVLGLVNMMGWFDWSEPIPMVFSSGKNNSLLAQIPEQDLVVDNNVETEHIKRSNIVSTYDDPKTPGDVLELED